jgi:hypothetical protein
MPGELPWESHLKYVILKEAQKQQKEKGGWEGTCQ